MSSTRARILWNKFYHAVYVCNAACINMALMYYVMKIQHNYLFVNNNFRWKIQFVGLFYGIYTNLICFCSTKIVMGVEKSKTKHIENCNPLGVLKCMNNAIAGKQSIIIIELKLFFLVYLCFCFFFFLGIFGLTKSFVMFGLPCQIFLVFFCNITSSKTLMPLWTLLVFVFFFSTQHAS